MTTATMKKGFHLESINKVCIKHITMILSLLTLCGALATVFLFHETRYAKAEDVTKMSVRLDYKILEDQYFATNQRIWVLDSRYPDKSKMPESVKEEHRELQEKLILIKDKISKIEAQKK